MAEELSAHIDFETLSPVDLVKSGVYKYVENLNTGVWGFTWSLGGQLHNWRPGSPDPVELLDHVARDGVVTAHNSTFERLMWNFVLRRYVPHWPALQIEQMDCTMARAAAVAHPQKLETLGVAVGSSQLKDLEGHALMLKMCKPRRYNADGSITWWDEPEKRDRLERYQRQDVVTECEIDKRLPPLTAYERRVWEFDQRINDRGIYVDANAIEKCAEMVGYANKAADSEMRRITNRAVPKCSSDNKLIEWIQSRGIDCSTVKKSVQEDLIFMAGLSRDDLIKEAIELRRASKKTSTAKYKAFLVCLCQDSRVRGLLNYHGASTGRWAGRLVQPQNFPRMDPKKYVAAIQWMHELLETHDAKEVFDCIVSVYGPDYPLKLLSAALRSMIRAPQGKKLVGGDFANIEGRVNAYLAGEQWKLQAFREYDNGTGADLYKLAYAKSFGVTVEAVDDVLRQIGKVMELALGYQGSVGAFITMGDTYGVNPYDLSGPIYAATSAYQWDATAFQYHKKGTHKHGLEEKEWTAIKVIVDNFRKANSKIVQFWWDLQDAAVEAVSLPNHARPVGRVTYFSDGRCLWCVLPSGRMLCYSSPNVEREQVEYEDEQGNLKTRTRNKVTYLGMDSVTHQWSKQSMYGGLQCENVVSGTARCIMVDRMFAVEEAAYPVILTVHDEILSEVEDDGFHSAQEYERIMSTVPEFVQGLPLTAKAWEDVRYIK